MNVLTLSVGQLATNCYLVWDDAGHAAVIDPGDEAARILEEAAARDLVIEAVLLTHLHVDHVLALPALLEATDAMFVLPKEECPALTDEARSLLSWLPPVARFAMPAPQKIVEEGDIVTVGELAFTVWHTPGHTAGSSCYVLDNALFCGDTLFVGSVGRCDLPSGDETALSATLLRLSRLSADYQIFPGHGASGTLAHEKIHNPFMK